MSRTMIYKVKSLPPLTAYAYYTKSLTTVHHNTVNMQVCHRYVLEYSTFLQTFTQVMLVLYYIGWTPYYNALG